MEGYCDICRRKSLCNWLALYVNGSEGTRLCHECEMLVVEFIREQTMAKLEEKIKAKLTNQPRVT